MAIAHKDFSPKIIEPGIFGSKYEPFASLVERANSWIADSGARVLNVETVLVTNNDYPDREVSLSGYTGATLHQVVRVWFEEAAA